MTATDRIDAVLADACESGAVPGAVAAVADAGGVTYHKAFGWSDPDRRDPLDGDTVFRLASMTKLITAVAVMRLVDAGKLKLDDPITQHLPEFAAVKVLEGGLTASVRACAARPGRQLCVRCSATARASPMRSGTRTSEVPGTDGNAGDLLRSDRCSRHAADR